MQPSSTSPMYDKVRRRNLSMPSDPATVGVHASAAVMPEGLLIDSQLITSQSYQDKICLAGAADSCVEGLPCGCRQEVPLRKPSGHLPELGSLTLPVYVFECRRDDIIAQLVHRYVFIGVFSCYL